MSLNVRGVLQGKRLLLTFFWKVSLVDYRKHVVDHVMIEGCILAYDGDNDRMQPLAGFRR